MKKFSIFLLIPFLLFGNGCQTVKKALPWAFDLAKEKIGTSTNVLEQTADPLPIEGIVASGDFTRPVIIGDGNGGLYVAAEGAKMASIHLFVYVPKEDRWKGGMVIQSQHGGEADAGRVYVPDIELQKDGNGQRVFVSARLGKKEWGSKHGPCLYILQPDGKGSFHYPGLTIGAARLSTDGSAVFLMSKDGAWAQLDKNGNMTKTGTFPAGSTGEKFDFSIDGSRWTSAHNGYSKQASAYAFGTIAGGKRVTWADYETYPEQGHDLCYPSALTIGNWTYIVSVFGGRLCLQKFVDGVPVFNTTKLKDLGPATMEDRCPPRLFRKPDGAGIVFKRGRSIMLGDVEGMIAGGSAREVGEGSFPAACWDGRAIRVLYVGGGAIQVRTE